MSRHVEAAATSCVLKVRTRFESWIGMRYSTNALRSFSSLNTHTHTNDDCVLTFFKFNFYSYAAVFNWRLCRYASNEIQLVNFVSEYLLAVPFVPSRQLQQA